MATKTLKKTQTANTARSMRKPTTGKGSLEAQIPGMEFHKNYISRKVSGKLSEFEVFQYARDSKTNVLIEGPTGPGKTSAVMAYAAKNKRPFYAVPSNVGIEPSQLFGKFIPSKTGSGFEWVDGPVTKIVREGGVLLINEVNFIPERVATVLFGLLDKRRQIVLLDHEAEVITAHDDLLVIADMNPDYEGTRPLNKAFRNRFGVQLWWDYDENVEKKLVKSKSLLAMVQSIRAEAAKGTYDTPVSTNMMMEFEKIAVNFDYDFAVLNFLNHFNPDEKGAVDQVLKTWSANIESELIVDEEEEVEEDLTSQYPDDHEIWKDRETKEDGWEDPEWGIKGVDWVFSSES